MKSVDVDKVDDLIKENSVVVFSKTHCPHAAKTKRLLTLGKIKFTLIELDLLNNGKEIQDKLAEKTGQKTVPNVFINNQHIGGNSDVMDAFKQGKLQEKL